LFIHNRYLHTGGEDIVFANEKELLINSGEYEITEMEFSNEIFHERNLIHSLVLSSLIIFNPISFYKVYKKVKKDKIDIVHVHNFFYHATPSIFWAAKLAGARTILTVHNYRLLCVGGNLLRKGRVCEKCLHSRTMTWGVLHRCFKKSFFKSFMLTGSNQVNRLIGTMTKKVDFYLSLTPFMSELLQFSSLRIPKEKIIEKANFVNDFGFSSIEDRRDFYLYVGRLSKEKGIIQLLQSWSDIDAPLYIVGDGDLKNEVIEIVSQNKNIHFLGFKAQAEVNVLVRSCKALVFPSVWYEGMPMTILEAKSCGTIVIANRTKNIEHLVTHLADGILYNGQIKEGIELFSGLSKTQFKLMMHQSRLDFDKRFNKQVALSNLSQIYQKVIQVQ